ERAGGGGRRAAPFGAPRVWPTPPPNETARPQARGGLAPANSEEFLPRIEAIAMLRRERARRGNTFDVGEQQTSRSQRNDPLDVAQAQPGKLERWQPRRHLSGGGHPAIGKGKRRCHHDRYRNDRKPHRPRRKSTLAKHAQQDRDDAEREYNVVDLAQLTRQ